MPRVCRFNGMEQLVREIVLVSLHHPLISFHDFVEMAHSIPSFSDPLNHRRESTIHKVFPDKLQRVAEELSCPPNAQVHGVLANVKRGMDGAQTESQLSADDMADFAFLPLLALVNKQPPKDILDGLCLFGV